MSEKQTIIRKRSECRSPPSKCLKSLYAAQHSAALKNHTSTLPFRYYTSLPVFFNDHHPHKSTPLSTRYLLTIPLTRLKHSSSPLRSFQSATGVLLTKLIGFLKTLIISNSDFIKTSSELFSTSSELIRTSSELIRTSSELISTSAEVIHLLRRSISKPAKKRPRTFLPFLQSFHLPRIFPFNRSGAKVCKIRVRSMIHNKQFSFFINHLRRFV